MQRGDTARRCSQSPRQGLPVPCLVRAVPCQSVPCPVCAMPGPCRVSLCRAQSGPCRSVPCRAMPVRAVPGQRPGSRPARAVPAAPALRRSFPRGAERSAPLRPRAAGAAAAVALRPLRRQWATGAMAELPLPAGLDARTFPAKLWRLANSPRVRSVRWDAQGRGLLIDRALFEQELLSPAGVQGPAPRTFRATRFRSIVRQLNRYGFYKVPGRAGAAVPGDAGAWLHYSNACFRRDRPHLLLRIRRRSTASKHRPAPGPERRRRSPCGSQQLPRQRPRTAGPEGRGRFQPLPRERPPSGFLLLHRERPLPDERELRSRRPSRFQQPPRERPLLARRPPCGFHLLHRDRPQPARRDGPSRFQELYGERPLPAGREVPRIPPCELLGLYGEPLLPVRREGLSRLQELHGLQPPPAGLPPWAFQQPHTERPPPAGRELLRIPPCSFQQLHTEQQSPACKASGRKSVPKGREK